MIRVLPPEVVNQIAAGEVVERPFSVVKELVENALDAGASSIEVELIDGGKSSIIVRDDGVGFSSEDLELAFISHATSKLQSLSDLDHVASLGFRGEALASIGSVSRARIVSRPKGASEGFEISCAVGALESKRPAGCPPGTRIEVHDLFAAIPARRRFLRTGRAEKARIQDLLARLSLARLDVSFRLSSEGKVTLDLPAGESLKDRVARALGRQFADHTVAVSRNFGELHVEGLTCLPDAARRDSQLGLLYVNGRLAKDRGVTHAIRAAYRGLLVHGGHPAYVLQLTMPPDLVDVNVHPQKAEVRFAEARRVAGLLHESVRDALSTAGHEQKAAIQVDGSRPKARSGFPELPRDLFARAGLGEAPVPTQSPSRSTASEVHESRPTEPAPVPGTRDADRQRRKSEPPAEVAEAGDPFWRNLGSRRFLQVLDLYLVFESPDGLVVVDQHALHERILFERFVREAKLDRAVPVQRLLVPDVVELSARDKEWMLDHREVLAEEGFHYEDFGGGAIAVQGVPALLGRLKSRKLVEELLGEDEDEARPKAKEALVERFHTKACRAAVMAGDRLGEQEIRDLLQEASRCEDPSRCPHGRPTILTFPPEELERYFRRTT